ncbi:MAG: hypothetical protein ABII06_16190 [Pseudomonadota bacterium]
MTDEATRREIDKVVDRTLKDAGLKDPPFLIEDILEHLDIDREFYNLEDVTLLRRFWHKVRVRGQRLVKIVKKINLHAIWLPDEERIFVDSSLPAPKQDWASFHDSVHTFLEWHRAYFLGDTAQTLAPDFQEMLEGEANYGASGLMFGGKLFTKEALDKDPEWKSIKLLKNRYKKSWVTTGRRYVQFSHDLPMVLVISTPLWMDNPDDQEDRCRHFVPSTKFMTNFASVSSDMVLQEIDDNIKERRGGPVGEFGLCLPDVNAEMHEFYAESFFNRHYVITFLVYQGKLKYF